MSRTDRSNRGRVEWTTLDSRLLRGNPLGDPHVRRFPVYLPPGYDRSRERYPLLVALSGFTGRGPMFLNTPTWGETMDARLDRLFEERRIGKMIVAMPDCFTHFGGSQYIDSAGTGRYASYLVREVVPHLDRTFRTLPGARHRGIFGKSSGGYGAIVHGMTYPTVWGAIACHSGDMGFEYCYWPDIPGFLRTLERHGGPEKFVRAFAAAPRKSHDMIAALNILAMAANYSPNRRRPLGIDWPIDLETGAPVPAVWRRWLEHDPLRLAARRARALRGLRLVFLDCGLHDEFNLLWGARQMVRRLRQLRVRHHYEEFDDGHMDISYRFDRSLPLLWSALRRGRPPERARGRG
jgi:S-formylglutathione hydrolase FrmB